MYAAAMLGSGIRDMTSGFRAYRVEALRKLDPWRAEASGYGFQIEMAWRARAAGLNIVEVPITFRDRSEGTSKMDRSIALEAVGLVTKWGYRRMTGRLRFPAGED
jgi:dolichol-phosphate mannosyltransferase